MSRFGIPTTASRGFTNYDKRKCVEEIKDKRNDLAHGAYSFADIGTRLRYERLGQRDQKDNIVFLKKSCFDFLLKVLGNIETYINNEDYKQAS